MPINMSREDKSFLVTYLNSIPGQNQILRAISGNAQPKLNVADIEEVKARGGIIITITDKQNKKYTKITLQHNG